MRISISKMLSLAEKYYKPKSLAHAIRVANYAFQNQQLYDYDVDEDLLFCIALAHDLLEDTDCTEAEIEKIIDIYGLNAVKLLTKDSQITYKDYIENIVNSQNLYAIVVKRADMKDHLSQTETLTDKLKEKYLPVVSMLL